MIGLHQNNELRIETAAVADTYYVRANFSNEHEMARFVMHVNDNIGPIASAWFRFYLDGPARAQWLAMRRIIQIYDNHMIRKTIQMRTSLFPQWTFSSDTGIADGGQTMVGLNFIRELPVPL